jgi:hypothetical protein
MDPGFALKALRQWPMTGIRRHSKSATFKNRASEMLGITKVKNRVRFAERIIFDESATPQIPFPRAPIQPLSLDIQILHSAADYTARPAFYPAKYRLAIQRREG